MSDSGDRPVQPSGETGEASGAERAPETDGAPETNKAPAATANGDVSTPERDTPSEEGPPPGSPEATGAVQVTTDSAHGHYVAHVRYGALSTTGNATATAADFGRNDHVILRTNRGSELGIALTVPGPVAGDVGETVGHVLRKATERDLAEERRIKDELEPEEACFCKRKISERGLRMRLASVEHIFGGERIVFYFTSERRVDFRALVRDLAWHFHTRIELRQVGARDEARLLADFEHCGRPICCKVFLRHLEPVTMRMAKLQRTTLDPQKISGRCGRLMCCLRFEDEVYRELRKGLPHKGTRVHVGSSLGEVTSTDILTQRATVKLDDGNVVRVPVTELRPPPDGDIEKQAASAAADTSSSARGRPRDARDASQPTSSTKAATPAKAGKSPSSAPSRPSRGSERKGGRDTRPAPSRSSKGGEREKRPNRRRRPPRSAPPGGGGSEGP